MGKHLRFKVGPAVKHQESSLEGWPDSVSAAERARQGDKCESLPPKPACSVQVPAVLTGWATQGTASPPVSRLPHMYNENRASTYIKGPFEGSI